MASEAKLPPVLSAHLSAVVSWLDWLPDWLPDWLTDLPKLHRVLEKCRKLIRR